MSAIYISLSNNHTINRLSLGYGLQYQKMEWDRRNGIFDTFSYKKPEVSKSEHTLGVVLSSYFQWGKLYMGCEYRPSFVTIAPYTAFNYQHTVSFDVVFKMRLRKKKFSK